VRGSRCNGFGWRKACFCSVFFNCIHRFRLGVKREFLLHGWEGGNVMYIRMIGIFSLFGWDRSCYSSLLFLGIHFYFHSIIMILKNLIHPQTIPVAQATLTPISGKNSYFVRIPLSFPVNAINGAVSSIATTQHSPR